MRRCKQLTTCTPIAFILNHLPLITISAPMFRSHTFHDYMQPISLHSTQTATFPVQTPRQSHSISNFQIEAMLSCYSHAHYGTVEFTLLPHSLLFPRTTLRTSVPSFSQIHLNLKVITHIFIFAPCIL